MYQETKETPATGFLDPGIEVSRFKPVADAIRRGCEEYPKQARGALYGYGSACVLGAAVAGGIAEKNQLWSALVYYPLKNGNRARFKNTLRIVMVHLNDTSRWSREKIADWLETLE